MSNTPRLAHTLEQCTCGTVLNTCRDVDCQQTHTVRLVGGCPYCRRIACVQCAMPFKTFLEMHAHLQAEHHRPLDPARTGEWQGQPPPTPFRPPYHRHATGQTLALNGAQPPQRRSMEAPHG